MPKRKRKYPFLTNPQARAFTALCVAHPQGRTLLALNERASTLLALVRLGLVCQLAGFKIDCYEVTEKGMKCYALSNQAS